MAKLAGTSIATVSLVVNNKTAGRVSEPNIERVRAAIDELGYVVDHTASSLARGTSNIVIMVAPDFSNPFYGRVITGVKDELGAEYQLLLSVTPDGRNPNAEDVRRLLALRPAGILVEAPDDAFLRDVPHGAPLVLLDAPGHETEAPTVNFDIASGMTALLEHLRAQGHSRIGYLDSLTRTETFKLRRVLLETGAAERGMQFVSLPDAASLIDPDAAAGTFAQHWPSWREAGVTALVCATDYHAFGVLTAARELGVRVPEDLVVTGFDNLPASSIVSPSLTTIELPGELLGRGAVRALFERGGSADSATTVPLIDSRLIVRGSSA